MENLVYQEWLEDYLGDADQRTIDEIINSLSTWSEELGI